MNDLYLALDYLVPEAIFLGSLTDNTQASYDAITWQDSRPKPTWTDVSAADIIVYGTHLKGRAADIRWQRQNGGFTYRGIMYATDFASPAAFGTAYARAQADSNYSTQWKTFDQFFVSLTARDIITLVEAIQNFTDALFAAEAQCDAGIDAGTITTETQIVAIINAVPNSL